MFSRSLLLFALSCVAVATNAFPLEARQSSETFSLYAYGDGISGLPVYYADGKAQIGDPSKSAAKVTEEVYFTVATISPNTYIAHPKKDSSSFSNFVLTLPSDGKGVGDVVFAPKNQQSVSSDAASVFSVYGNYVLINSAGANFYAEKTGDGVWDLVWSDTPSGYVAITLRTIAPSTDVL
ncbi:hypothetical protein BDW74DRAFT_175203 [Aspergillus multicolor]|uniref:uncharacterized protein n=1 Tax=Aspergillus multicolor TaxID=41759 RepID=UPI003CCCAE37